MQLRPDELGDGVVYSVKLCVQRLALAIPNTDLEEFLRDQSETSRSAIGASRLREHHIVPVHIAVGSDMVMTLEEVFEWHALVVLVADHPGEVLTAVAASVGRDVPRVREREALVVVTTAGAAVGRVERAGAPLTVAVSVAGITSTRAVGRSVDDAGAILAAPGEETEDDDECQQERENVVELEGGAASVGVAEVVHDGISFVSCWWREPPCEVATNATLNFA